jgi:hypothetical protein
LGTFHDDKHELHGITVVVDTDGDEIFVGRCDDMDAQRLILLDADLHRDGEDGESKEEWVRKAARVGVWPRHRRLVLPRERVTTVRRLGEV